MAEPVRINKFISQCGYSSRRKADQLIEEGLVTVNGKKVESLGLKIHPFKDKVKVSGKILKPAAENVYIMFHKPKNVLSSMSESEERPTVRKYFEHLRLRVFPVGRLDWNTEGLLLLTNDGEFSNKVMHPKEEILKTYFVKVEGRPTEEKIQKLLTGVSIQGGGKVKARKVEKLKKKDSKHTWYKVIISEGKYRQIRRMFEKIGYDVLKLQRVSIGNLQLGNLDRGDYKFLKSNQLDKIFKGTAKLKKKKKKKRKTSLKRI